MNNYKRSKPKNIRKSYKKSKSKRSKAKTLKKSKSPRKWSIKYKRSIDCDNPRGFSQKQYCKYGRNGGKK